jgi:predicted nucleic acid-binding protein
VILVDTSVWVHHLRHGDDALARLLNKQEILTHPSVIGELALGSLRNREIVPGSLAELPSAAVAEHSEVMTLIETQRLWNLGIGYDDAHLLASVYLTPGSWLWTRDRALADAAKSVGRLANL